MAKTDRDKTETWIQYQHGIDYNSRIGLYENVNRNEAFYAGDQWRGVQANGLPTPVFNFYKRIINYFIASILSQDTAINFVPENVGDEPDSEEEQEIKDAAELITQYSETLKEKLKLNYMLRQWLLDSAVSGDACAYSYWDPTIDTMQDIMGDINMESIDNVNVFFGNPNDRRVQTQPYIIIAFRQLVGDLRAEAKRNKVPEDKIRLITADEETSYQSGDRSKVELDSKDDATGKAIALLKLWKKDGVVYAKKSTCFTDIRPEWNTKLSLYPVAWKNWDTRKNSYHGQALGTGLIPNQVFINKMFAMAMMSLMHTAFPKAIYDKNTITAWSNTVGGAIGINRQPGESITGYATYMNPGEMSNQVLTTIDKAIEYTKDMLGASDAALGDVKPDNTSAIIAVQQAASVPLESIKQNLYQFVEDIGYIWLDIMATHYGKRSIDVEVMGKRVIKEFDFAKLKKMKFRIKIDVGPSSYWSQITAIQTLDNLLQAERISFTQYLERLPSGLIPQKQELIEEIKQQDTKQQFIYEQMARFMEQLPPEVQAMIQQMPPEEQEGHLMEMMMMPPEQLPVHIQEMMMGAMQPQQPQQPMRAVM